MPSTIKNGTLLVKDSNGNTARVATLSESDVTTLNTTLESVKTLQNTYVDKDTLVPVEVMTQKTKFFSNALADALNFKVQRLFTEDFSNTDDIDQTKLDGAAVVGSYYDSTKQVINISDGTTKVFQSVAQTVPETFGISWASVDKTGTGTTTFEISRDGGTTFTAVPLGSTVDISTQPDGTSVVYKLTMAGDQVITGLAFGFLN